MVLPTCVVFEALHATLFTRWNDGFVEWLDATKTVVEFGFDFILHKCGWLMKYMKFCFVPGLVAILPPQGIQNLRRL